MGGDAQALRQPFDLAKPLGLRHRLGGDIAHRDVAALGDQLARELAAHARAAPGDDRDLSGKILHGDTAYLFCCNRPEMRRRAHRDSIRLIGVAARYGAPGVQLVRSRRPELGSFCQIADFWSSDLPTRLSITTPSLAVRRRLSGSYHARCSSRAIVFPILNWVRSAEMGVSRAVPCTRLDHQSQTALRVWLP